MNWKVLGRVLALAALILMGPSGLFWVFFLSGTAGTAMHQGIAGNISATTAVGQVLLSMSAVVVLIALLYAMLRASLGRAHDIRRSREGRKRSHRPPC